MGGRKTFVATIFIAFLLFSFTDIPQNEEAPHSVPISDLQFSQIPIPIPSGEDKGRTYD
jgi:hypothetical protein